MGFEESTTEENPEKSTGPPDDTPESYWVWAGCDSMLTPYMAAEFRDLGETGASGRRAPALLFSFSAAPAAPPSQLVYRCPNLFPYLPL